MQKGFSLLELLVVIAIIGVVIGVLTIPLNAFRARTALATEIQEVTALINKARTQSISSYNDSQYGVRIEAGKVTLFAGAMYTTDISTHEVHTLSNLVTFSEIAVNGGSSDVVFKKVTGATDTYATSTLRTVSGDVARTLVVQPSGIVATY